MKATIQSHLVLKAVDFAARKHRDQRRKDHDASPYVNHPIAVAMLIAEVGGVQTPEILAAALLHDTVEDTQTTPEELELEFGVKVRQLVEEVTDDKNLPKVARKRHQIEHAAVISEGAVLIKLGDKISNVMDVTNSPPKGWDIQRRQEYLAWAESVIANCRQANTALEQKFAEVVAQGRAALISSS